MSIAQQREFLHLRALPSTLLSNRTLGLRALPSAIPPQTTPWNNSKRNSGGGGGGGGQTQTAGGA